MRIYTFCGKEYRTNALYSKHPMAFMLFKHTHTHTLQIYGAKQTLASIRIQAINADTHEIVSLLLISIIILIWGGKNGNGITSIVFGDHNEPFAEYNKHFNGSTHTHRHISSTSETWAKLNLNKSNPLYLHNRQLIESKYVFSYIGHYHWNIPFMVLLPFLSLGH